MEPNSHHRGTDSYPERSTWHLLQRRLLRKTSVPLLRVFPLETSLRQPSTRVPQSIFKDSAKSRGINEEEFWNTAKNSKYTSKYRGNFCPAFGNTGVISVRSYCHSKVGIPRDVKNYFRSSSKKKRAGKTSKLVLSRWNNRPVQWAYLRPQYQGYQSNNNAAVLYYSLFKDAITSTVIL
jgi:hypothetical protein